MSIKLLSTKRQLQFGHVEHCRCFLKECELNESLPRRCSKDHAIQKYSLTLNIHLTLKNNIFSLFCLDSRFKSKQWPLAPNSPKWRITRANVSNASHILANVGECIECRMYRVREKGLANVGRMYRVRAK